MSALTDITSNEVGRKRKFGTFIDLYAGCGGLSLGLMMAGWIGLFAIERDRHAFETLHHNLIEGLSRYKFKWPSWLPKKRFRIGPFLKKYHKQLEGLRGQVDLLVGGPPCQGFSMAGKRRKNDPRNRMFRHYIEMVQLVRPSYVLLENVQGIDVEFQSDAKAGNKRNGKETFAVRIQTALEELNYRVFVGIVNASEYGVPQMRKRYFMIAVAKEQLTESCQQLLDCEAVNPFEVLRSLRQIFLAQKGLSTESPITVRDAISDLRTINRRLIECEDSPGFKQISYTTPKTPYQILLHGTKKEKSPNSMRLVNHRKETVRRFKRILATCRRGVLLSRADRKRLGMKKHATVPLDGSKPSHTLTTLPDDLLHYLEPRILTVRESARLQSFPDWFEFKGNYTTGGRQRVHECPRYTQVGNAVPPLLAEVIGLVLAEINNMVTEIKTGQYSFSEEVVQSHLTLRAA
jgi:DNA (cytosine-5)-methyltransferase 1